MACSNNKTLQEFRLDENGNFSVDEKVQKVFDEDGAFVVRELISQEDVDKIWRVLHSNDDKLLKSAFDLPDGQGRASRLVLWNHPGEDFTGVLARSEKVAGSCEKLLGGEVYHYHTKVMMKEAGTGGQHLWHQDYGYWYKNGNLRPDLMTVFVAMDPCNKANGGLELLIGSHKCGRIDHDLVHGQTVAQEERVQLIRGRFCHVVADLNPGDAIFFHCNVLHSSGPNDSHTRRYACLFAYNRADNDPVYEHHHPNYTPLVKVPNSAIKLCTNFEDISGKSVMNPNTDRTIQAAKV